VFQLVARHYFVVVVQASLFLWAKWQR